MIQQRKIFGLLFSLAALVAVGAKDQPSQPIVLSPEQAIKEGRALVDEMLSRQPEENTVTGIMTIRDKKKFTQFPIQFRTVLTPTNWLTVYEATFPNSPAEQITIVHSAAPTNNYILPEPLSKQTIYGPFAGSDFSIADLGLEFLHWPEQRLVQKEMKRSRSCRVLESINPHATAGAYSRVKSWIDAESDGIVYAEAYDMKGNKIKEFIPKDFSKVNGQWQLEEMQISDTQKDSTTTVKFNLKQ